ncbi:hypothetical protein GOODEAATRI_003066 [Goodea atripinnis]|uniref:Uncharacterized protein n=1 Tax=Goodea atripinnis TaxID=208336 RepID=A0ABV0MZQ7_9TELE
MVKRCLIACKSWNNGSGRRGVSVLQTCLILKYRPVSILYSSWRGKIIFPSRSGWQVVYVTLVWRRKSQHPASLFLACLCSPTTSVQGAVNKDKILTIKAGADFIYPVFCLMLSSAHQEPSRTSVLTLRKLMSLLALSLFIMFSIKQAPMLLRSPCESMSECPCSALLPPLIEHEGNKSLLYVCETGCVRAVLNIYQTSFFL